MSASNHSASDAAHQVLARLHEAGHTALLAGGCVRDMLLGVTPKDFDIATNATPEQVGDLFPYANHVGAKFGVMLVRKYGFEVEIATFRTDGAYTDGRRPDSVTFGTDREDALRRDFTINGMFFDVTTDQVIDYVNGREDLDRRLIRTIGDARERFGEDHLRMLRAVRFAARLEFEIEPETREAITALAPNLRLISPERIWMELAALLIHPRRHHAWRLLTQLGLAPHLTSAWEVPQEIHERIAQRLEALGPNPVSSTLGMSALLCDGNEGASKSVCQSLRQSNRDIALTAWLVASLPVARRVRDLELADVKALMAHESWSDLTALLRADLVAHGETLHTYEALMTRSGTIRPESVAPPPLLDGHGLAMLGAQPGPGFGRILDEVYRAQRNELISTEPEAQALAQQLLIEGG